MSCRKYGFLGHKNLPDVKGIVPTKNFAEENHEWCCDCIYKCIYTDNDTAGCSEEEGSLRLAKKKAFQKYRKIVKEGFIND